MLAGDLGFERPRSDGCREPLHGKRFGGLVTAPRSRPPWTTEISYRGSSRGCYCSAVSLNDLYNGFRDNEQRRRVRAVVHDRLADDRNQQECRYLMRFWWQLGTTVGEVSLEQLGRYVGGPKLAAIEDLIRAVRSSPAEIDAWIEHAEHAFPVAADRGLTLALAECDIRLRSEG